MRLIGTVQDISDRKAIEAVLAESRERFTHAASAAREGVWDSRERRHENDLPLPDWLRAFRE